MRQLRHKISMQKVISVKMMYIIFALVDGNHSFQEN